MPEPGAGEMLVRVDACGVCATDLKKIQKGLLPGPRIFGHEIAGTVGRARGGRRRGFREGQRVVVHHHVPCGTCFYCARAALRAVRASTSGTGRRPASSPRAAASPSTCAAWTGSSSGARSRSRTACSPEEAAFVEPVNTCLKAVRKAGVAPGRDGAGRRPGADRPPADAARAAGRARRCVASDTMAERRAVSRRLGADVVLDARGGRRRPRCAGLTGGPWRRLRPRRRRGRGGLRAGRWPRRGPPGASSSSRRRPAARRPRSTSGRSRPSEKDILTAYSSSIDVQEQAAAARLRPRGAGARAGDPPLPARAGARGVRPRRSRPAPGMLKVVLEMAEDAMSRDRTMKAAVLYGREDVRIEQVARARAGPGRGAAAHRGGAHLRHRRQGLPPRATTPG